MPRLVVAHLLQDRARPVVGYGDLFQMAIQVLLDLVLGLGDEAQADPVARAPRRPADGKRARVPERVEQAGTRAELAQPFGAPAKVVFFLARRLIHLGANLRRARGQLLGLVKGLRADLAHVVDAHEPSHVAALRLVEALRIGRKRLGRIGAAGAGDACDRAQGHIEFANQGIHGCMRWWLLGAIPRPTPWLEGETAR